MWNLWELLSKICFFWVVIRISWMRFWSQLILAASNGNNYSTFGFDREMSNNALLYGAWT